MLIEFEVKNFRSIRDAAALSLAKGGGNELEDTNAFSPAAPATPDLLHGAAIYGPNASGKTNLLRALAVMQEIVLHSAKDQQQDEPLPVEPFLLDVGHREQPSEFEIHFAHEGVRYQYGFSAAAERIGEEWLIAYPKGRPQRWVERSYDAEARRYDWGQMTSLAGAKQAKELWKSSTRDNALFLSTAVQLNNEQLRPVYDWFAKTLRIAKPDLSRSLFRDYATNRLCERPEGKQMVLDFLRVAHIDMDDIVLEEEEQGERDEFSADIGRKLPRAARGRKSAAYRLENGAVQKLDWDDESDGTRQLFAYAAPILRVLRESAVLVIDELHDHLHPLLLRLLVKLFHAPQMNRAHAQLIFTTHDTAALDRELLRRDQIWFCEKKERATQLIPLADFSPRKSGENIERGYLSGRYGALPHVRNTHSLEEIVSGGPP